MSELSASGESWDAAQTIEMTALKPQLSKTVKMNMFSTPPDTVMLRSRPISSTHMPRMPARTLEWFKAMRVSMKNVIANAAKTDRRCAVGAAPDW